MDETLTEASASPSVGVARDLVLDAMRLAERAHRQSNHFRKAPEGEDRPAYFLHLAEVAWLLKDAGLSDEVVAAGFLHDMIEDCGYTKAQLADELGNSRVADLVAWVSEPEKGQSWEVRNQVYLERMKTAPVEVLALSCADKTSNLRDMLRLLARGYQLADIMSRGYEQQVGKFEALSGVFQGVVPSGLYRMFQEAYVSLRGHGEVGKG